MSMQPGFVPTGSLQLMSAQSIEELLPALPEAEGTIYVPPMYTQPRAIIPRYRAISGLLSVLIVTLLLCSGGIYYAQASGKLAVLQQLYGAAPPPPSLKAAAQPNIPDPPAKPDYGPAYAIIPSATTTASISPQSDIALQPTQLFAVNQKFYVTYSVQRPKTDGTVTIKWYMDKLLFQSATSKTIKANSTINGDAQQVYLRATSGMVELYWNNQLAQRLYFVVR
jgi:hypothetical protein